jgi:hypothetical protein
MDRSQTVKNFLLQALHVIGIGVTITAVLFHPINVLAAIGTPDSTQFGYGARLDPLGQGTGLALKASTSVGLDWIGIDLDWSHFWPQETANPNLDPIDVVMKDARNYGLNVMLSIYNAPAWAKAASGPDPDKTARLVSILASRYSRNSLSIELFPAANTIQGWGAAPDPKAYTTLLKTTWKALHASGSKVTLVAAGLQPLSPGHDPRDVDDTAFLSGLYEAGAASLMPVVSLRLMGLSSDVMSAPDASSPNVLRRYETIRQVMLTHRHTNGIIWITAFTWPARGATSTSEQSRWIRQAYNLLRAQLYIGVAFFDRLNPPADGYSAPNNQYLLQIEAQKIRLHPALDALGILITLDRSGQDISPQGSRP